MDEAADCQWIYLFGGLFDFQRELEKIESLPDLGYFDELEDYLKKKPGAPIGGSPRPLDGRLGKPGCRIGHPVRMPGLDLQQFIGPF